MCPGQLALVARFVHNPLGPFSKDRRKTQVDLTPSTSTSTSIFVGDYLRSTAVLVGLMNDILCYSRLLAFDWINVVASIMKCGATCGYTSRSHIATSVSHPGKLYPPGTWTRYSVRIYCNVDWIIEILMRRKLRRTTEAS